jgi:Histidine kinase-like ATPase domain
MSSHPASASAQEQLGLSTGELVIAAQPVGVRGARRFAEAWLRTRHLANLVNTVHLIVSELTTNSVKATCLPDSATADAPAAEPGSPEVSRPVAMVTLRLTLIGPSLFVIVRDNDPQAPVLQDPADLDEDGRGLALVAALSRTWGHYPVGTAGKAVWAEIDVSGAPGGTASQSLPRREGDDWEHPQARGVRPMEDMGTLRRVLDGLNRIQES